MLREDRLNGWSSYGARRNYTRLAASTCEKLMGGKGRDERFVGRMVFLWPWLARLP